MIATGALPELRIPSISASAMKTMAVILDDPNVIHLDPEAVSALGLGDKVINQGPSNSGYVMDMLNAAFPGGRITRFSARFHSNVFSGDAVTAGGTVDTIENGIAFCSVWLRVDPDRLALEASAEVALAG